MPSEEIPEEGPALCGDGFPTVKALIVHREEELCLASEMGAVLLDDRRRRECLGSSDTRRLNGVCCDGMRPGCSSSWLPVPRHQAARDPTLL
ncbi:unnamed protein product [Boreogadus saida]